MPLLDQPLGRVLLVVALLALASLGLALARRRDGVFRSVAPVAVAHDGDPHRTAVLTDTPSDTRSGSMLPDVLTDVLTEADLGRPLGTSATLVQLSSPGCATCPQVRRVLADLAGERPGVVHVEIDAAQRLDLARRLNVLRTPTVLMLGPRGELRARASGRVEADAVARALDGHLTQHTHDALETPHA